ncbi:MAG: M14 family zinc carboxypeptidase [Phycisphaerales bacterium]|nr:M14 family zinc carboxypeptidase [Phycisphaerales bacterium]
MSKVPVLVNINSQILGLVGVLALLVSLFNQQAHALHSPRGMGLQKQAVAGTQMLAVIDVPTLPDFEMISELGARPWGCRPGLGRGVWLVTNAQLRQAEALGLRCQITVRDVHKLILAEEKSRQDSRRVGDWFSDYRTYDEVVTKIDALVAAHDGISEKIVLGSTHENRDIVGLVINTDSSTEKPAILLNGCQHAREWISVMVPMYIAEQLLVGYGTDPQITLLLDSTEVVIVPIVNPDGYVYSHTTERLWRKNRRNNGNGTFGVDLNRNWDIDWGGPESTSTNSNSDVYIGEGPFSEPETSSMRDLVLSRDNIVAHIDFHNYSQLILQPWGHTNDLPADYEVINDLGARMNQAIYDVHGESYPHGSGSTFIYLASGTCEDWHYSQGIFGYTIELRPSSSQPGFLLGADQIIPTGEENFQAVLEMMEFANEPAQILFPEGQQLLINEGEDIDLLFGVRSGAGSGVDPSTIKVMAREVGSQFTPRPTTSIGDEKYTCTIDASLCRLPIEYYITAQTENGVEVVSPQAGPTQAYSVRVGAPFFIETLDEDPNWLEGGQWDYGVPTGGGGQYGNADPTSGATGNNVLGYNLNGDYANNLAESYLTTDPIDCSSSIGTQLRFARWLNVEQPTYDHASIQVSSNGSSWDTVWSNAGEITDSQWVDQQVDISAYADGQRALQIRWVMGTTDGGWRYSGWNIDDIRLVGQASPLPGIGSADLDCDGVVGLQDFTIFLINFNNCASVDYCRGDIDGNGTVDTDDFSYILIQYGN